MNRLHVTVVCMILTSTIVYGQDLNTSVLRLSERSELINRLDSIKFSTAKQYTRLRESYDSSVNLRNLARDHFSSRIDSLQKRGIATVNLITKLDSLISLKDKSIDSITSKVEKLRSAVNNAINELNLPPELREQANKLASIMNKLDITKPEVLQEYLNFSIPDLGSLPAPDIPGVEMGNPIQDMTNIDMPSVDMGDIGNQVKEYQRQMSELPKDLDGAAKLAEQQATNISAVADVQKELGRVDKITDMASTLQEQEKLKEQLVNEVKEQAIDHFADKKDHLDKAMQSISKYKQKFSNIGSLNDIPKKAPNEMKGKPLIERIVPGIAFQLQKKDDDLLVDFNLYLGYRFTRRFTSGGGWNQRLGYNTDKNAWSPSEARIYGPRIFSEYKLGKGFSPRVEVEVMNTFVPPYLNNTKSDPGSREWVWGAFVGMKKDYTLYKKIKGTAMVMLRLFDPERKSPYADVVSARFGVEIPIIKQTIKRQSK